MITCPSCCSHWQIYIYKYLFSSCRHMVQKRCVFMGNWVEIRIMDRHTSHDKFKESSGYVQFSKPYWKESTFTCHLFPSVAYTRVSPTSVNLPQSPCFEGIERTTVSISLSLIPFLSSIKVVANSPVISASSLGSDQSLLNVGNGKNEPLCIMQSTRKFQYCDLLLPCPALI